MVKDHIENPLRGVRTVLPESTQPASVRAVYPQRLAGSGRVRVCVEFLRRHLEHG